MNLHNLFLKFSVKDGFTNVKYSKKSGKLNDKCPPNVNGILCTGEMLHIDLLERAGGTYFDIPFPTSGIWSISALLLIYFCKVVSFL